MNKINYHTDSLAPENRQNRISSTDEELYGIIGMPFYIYPTHLYKYKLVVAKQGKAL